jgi:membrane peptidoglycan carboxypeptidase
MRKRDRSLLANAASLLVCGLLAGLVVAAAAFPAVAMGGLAAKAGADTFDSLPSDLNVLPAPQMSYVYANDGTTLLAYLYDENRLDVKFDDVPDVMRRAIVASEDARFYKHNGVDMKGVARAFVANQQASGVAQGASTLTMQYVRQVISYTARTPQQVIDATEDTPGRKAKEIKLALALEKRFSKQEILIRYLNIAAFGHQAYGIYAASQVYFGKPPSELKLPEAALLAGLVQAPSSYDPADPEKKPAALERRKYVLSQMVKMGDISQAQSDEAQTVELKIVGKHTPQGCTEVQRPDLNAGFFCDYLVRWWDANPAFGKDTFERENRLRSAGYKIITSLDINTQAGAMRNINEAMNSSKLPGYDALMLAGVEPGTGRVQTLAVNRAFSNDQSHNGLNTEPAKRAKGLKGNYPNTTVPLLSGGGDVIGYQAGSTFKIFTIVAALENGLPLDYTIETTSPYKSKYPAGANEPSRCADGPYYCPKNANPGYMNGSRNMWSGLGRSVNTYFVPLQEAVGADKVVEVAKRLGLQFHDENDEKFADSAKHGAGGPFTLGVTSQTPLEMANAWATLAADGMYCKPTPVLSILDAKGQKVPGAEPDCKQVVNPDVARGAIDAGRCPIGDQSAFGRCDGATAQGMHGIVGRPVSGKTGTTEDGKAAAMIMTTKQLTIAGTITDPDWTQTGQEFTHDQVNPTVAKTLRDGMAGKPAVNFTPPSRLIAFGNQVGIPSVHCATVQAASDTIRRAGFKVTVSNNQVNGDCPAGTVQRTSPDGKTIPGGPVALVISKGPAAGAPPPTGGGGGGGGPGPPCRRPQICPPGGGGR